MNNSRFTLKQKEKKNEMRMNKFNFFHLSYWKIYQHQLLLYFIRKFLNTRDESNET